MINNEVFRPLLLDMLPFGQDEMNIAIEKHKHDVCDRTNKIYDDVINSKYGFKAFFNHCNLVYKTNYSFNPPPPRDVLLPMLILFLTIKGVVGNENSVSFVGTQTGKKLAPSTVDIQMCHIKRAR